MFLNICINKLRLLRCPVLHEFKRICFIHLNITIHDCRCQSLRTTKMHLILHKHQLLVLPDSGHGIGLDILIRLYIACLCLQLAL